MLTRLATVVVLLLLLADLATADEILLKPERPGGTPVIRTGEIADYTGLELKLTTVAGRTETIPAERIQGIRSVWSPEFQVAEKLLAQGQFEKASATYREARRLETRRWVVRRITAQLVTSYTAEGIYEAAGAEFLALAIDDPQTLHLNIIPLPWRTLPVSPKLEAAARGWLTESRTPYGPLLGAAWLLNTNARTEATTLLTKMANGKAKSIALLAEVQLWRTKLLSVTEEDAQRWESIFARLNENERPTACYVLGDAFARLKKPDLAATYYLQLPILHPQNQAAAAEALLAAGKQLEQTTQPAAATNIFREVVRRFPGTDAAASAKARLPQEPESNTLPAGNP